ncbi:MAG: HlyD family efflux transporter periplasmic adaptor subunit [Chitinophagaceae bacterium]
MEGKLKFDEVNEINEPIHEVLKKPSGWLTNYGNMALMSVFLLVIVFSFFVRYPEVIPCKATLTSINAPKPVVTLIHGKLIKLSISEDQPVIKNQILGHIESTAKHSEVLSLSSDLNAIQTLLNNNKTELSRQYFNTTYSQLGEIQLSYQTFSQSFLNFKNYLFNGFYIEKKSMLAKDMSNLKRLHTNLCEQKGLNEEDLTLSQKTYEANQSLKEDKVISEFDLRLENSKLIDKKLSMPQINSAIINNESQQNEKQKEIAELENTINQQKIIFQQALSTFKSQVDEWKKNYLLVAPINGKIAFSSFIQENQQIQANQIICFINPENSEYFAELIIPQSNFGKAAIGQQVLLKFQSYPFQEYGAVKGKIEFISHIPADSGYLAKVGLTNGLNTNYKKQVQYRDGLIATGEIITKDMRLLERFYYNVVRQVDF